MNPDINSADALFQAIFGFHPGNLPQLPELRRTAVNPATLNQMIKYDLVDATPEGYRYLDLLLISDEGVEPVQFEPGSGVETLYEDLIAASEKPCGCAPGECLGLEDVVLGQAGATFQGLAPIDPIDDVTDRTILADLTFAASAFAETLGSIADLAKRVIRE